MTHGLDDSLLLRLQSVKSHLVCNYRSQVFLQTCPQIV